LCLLHIRQPYYVECSSDATQSLELLDDCFILYYTMFEFIFFFFKQKTAYEIPKRDWSSDVCSSDLFVKILQ